MRPCGGPVKTGAGVAGFGSGMAAGLAVGLLGLVGLAVLTSPHWANRPPERPEVELPLPPEVAAGDKEPPRYWPGMSPEERAAREQAALGAAQRPDGAEVDTAPAAAPESGDAAMLAAAPEVGGAPGVTVPAPDDAAPVSEDVPVPAAPDREPAPTAPPVPSAGEVASVPATAPGAPEEEEALAAPEAAPADMEGIAPVGPAPASAAIDEAPATAAAPERVEVGGTVAAPEAPDAAEGILVMPSAEAPPAPGSVEEAPEAAPAPVPALPALPTADAAPIAGPEQSGAIVDSLPGEPDANGMPGGVGPGSDSSESDRVQDIGGSTAAPEAGGLAASPEGGQDVGGAMARPEQGAVDDESVSAAAAGREPGGSTLSPVADDPMSEPGTHNAGAGAVPVEATGGLTTADPLPQAASELPPAPVSEAQPSGLEVTSDAAADEAAGASAGEAPAETLGEAPEEPALPSVLTLDGAALPGVEGVRIRRPGAEEAPAEEDVGREAAVEEALPEDAPALRRFAAPFEPPQDGRPPLSVVLVDDGALPDGPERLSALGMPVSVAVDLPVDEASGRAAAWREAGFEVLAVADLPPRAEPQDVEVFLGAALEAMPQAVAVLDLEGQFGGFDATAQMALARVARDGRGLVSAAQGLGAGLERAESAGVPAARVLRVLGEGEDAAAVRRDLDDAVRRAGQAGAAVVLGRLTPETLEGLADWSQEGRVEEVVMAPVSAVLLAGAAE